MEARAAEPGARWWAEGCVGDDGHDLDEIASEARVRVGRARWRGWFAVMA